MLDLLIKAALEAAKSSQAKEKAQIDRLRAENDARLAAEWAYQQAMAHQRAAMAVAPPPVAAPPPVRRPVQSQPVAARAEPRQRLASANALTVANWAQPRTLKSQFILTEILKPPLSMRRPK